MYNQMATIIEDVLKAHNKDEYLIAFPDGSVKHMDQMSFGWVPSTTGGVHLATSYDGYDGSGSRGSRNSLYFTFYCTTGKIQQAYY